jgi:chaperonin GroEL
LTDAFSVAGLLMTTEAMIVDIPEEKSAGGPPGMGGMPPGMMGGY